MTLRSVTLRTPSSRHCLYTQLKDWQLPQAGTESDKSVANGKLLVTISDAAALLSISRAACYQLISRGQIRSIKIGKLRRVPVSALQDFIALELGGSA